MSSDSQFLNRRSALKSAGILSAAAPLMRGEAVASQTPREVLLAAPLEAFNPYNKVDFKVNNLGYWDVIGALLDKSMAQHIISRIWKSYVNTINIELADWAAQYTYLYWRIVPLGSPRRKIARAGTKFANAMLKQDPDRAMGYFWKGAFLGLDAISIGALNAAQQIPAVRDILLRGIKIDPEYYYGTQLISLAKLYVKSPPFPAGVGSMKKAFELLERARPQQEKIYALYYMFLAEAQYLDGRLDQALETAASIESKVKPVDFITQFIFDSTRVDRDSFVKAVKGGTYSKYKWDPIFTPLPPDLITPQ